MINVIRSEWIKFRSVRSTVILVCTGGALVVLVAYLQARHQSGLQADQFTPATHLGDLTGGIPFALFLFGALGVQILGQEYRFSTIRPTFTAVPQRWRVLTAKLVVVSLATAAVSAVMLAVCALIGSAMVDGFAIDSTDHRIIWGTIVFAMGWTMLGMGVGAILRQPIAGMLILLIEAFVVENILVNLVTWTGKWVPFLNGIQMTIRDHGDGGDHPRLRSVTAGGVYFFIVAAVIWGIGAYLASRRDA